MLYNFLLNEVIASQAVADHEFLVLSPWVTNFVLDRPFHVTFTELVASKHEELHLFDVLRQMAANGSRVNITVGDDTRYHAPLRGLRDQSSRIVIRKQQRLHAKAYVGRFGALSGSLNLTDGGVNQNAEIYTYAHDPHSIANLRQICNDHFAAAEPL
jgi:hypothetical protein